MDKRDKADKEQEDYYNDGIYGADDVEDYVEGPVDINGPYLQTYDEYDDKHSSKKRMLGSM